MTNKKDKSITEIFLEERAESISVVPIDPLKLNQVKKLDYVSVHSLVQIMLTFYKDEVIKLPWQIKYEFYKNATQIEKEEKNWASYVISVLYPKEKDITNFFTNRIRRVDPIRILPENVGTNVYDNDGTTYICVYARILSYDNPNIIVRKDTIIIMEQGFDILTREPEEQPKKKQKRVRSDL